MLHSTCSPHPVDYLPLGIMIIKAQHLHTLPYNLLFTFIYCFVLKIFLAFPLYISNVFPIPRYTASQHTTSIGIPMLHSACATMFIYNSIDNFFQKKFYSFFGPLIHSYPSDDHTLSSPYRGKSAKISQVWRHFQY